MKFEDKINENPNATQLKINLEDSPKVFDFEEERKFIENAKKNLKRPVDENENEDEVTIDDEDIEAQLNKQMSEVIVPEMTFEKLKKKIERYYPEYVSILKNIEVDENGSFLKDGKPIDYKGIVDYIKYRKGLRELDKEIKKGNNYNRGY
jgi:hypothetical protein